MSEYFRVRLLQLKFDRPAAVHIQGLAIGIDVGADDYADAIHDKCRRNGLLVSTEGSTVLLLPSLAIDKRTADEGIRYSGALEMMRRGGVANPRVQPRKPTGFTERHSTRISRFSAYRTLALMQP